MSSSAEAVSHVSALEWGRYGRFVVDIISEGGRVIDVGRFIFRGQIRLSWGLESSFDRLVKKSVGQGDRRRLYDEYLLSLSETLFTGKYVDYPRASVHNLTSTLPYEIAAQHHGAPTRLLDWSTSPYVAAFFAFQSFQGGQSSSERFEPTVWALDTTRLQELVSEAECQIIRTPPSHLQRLFAQMGCFSKNVSSFRDLVELVSLAFKNGSGVTSGPVLFKIELRSSDQEIALADLRMMGIARDRMFPDIEGVLKSIRSNIEMRFADI